MDERGSRDGASLSEEAPCRGLGEGAPALGTLEDMLRKAPNMGISLYIGDPLQARGTCNLERGPIYRGL